MKWEKVSLHKIIEKTITGEWGREPVSDNGVVVIRSTNFTNRGEINLSKGVAIREIPEKKIVSKALREGDIIIEKSGGSPTQPVGRVIFFENIKEICLCSNFTSILRPKTKLVFPKYLHYQLFNHHQFGTTLKFQNKTTGIINLQLKRYVEKIQIPLPPLPIQRQIAELLDTATALRQRTEDQLAELDRLAESVFLDMFGDPVRNEKGWEVVKLEEVSDLSSGFAFKSKYYSKNSLDLKLCGGVNISTNNDLDWSSVNFWPKYDESKHKNFLLEERDIVLAMDRPWINGGMKICKIKSKELPLLLIQRTARVRSTGSKATQEYLFNIIRHEIFKLHVNITETTVPHISIKDLRKFEIPLPPLPLQTHFAEIIENLEVQKAVLRRSLQESEDLVGCLLQGVFA